MRATIFSLYHYLKINQIKYLECEKIKLLLFVQDFKNIYCSSEKLQKLKGE